MEAVLKIGQVVSLAQAQMQMQHRRNRWVDFPSNRGRDTRVHVGLAYSRQMLPSTTTLLHHLFLGVEATAMAVLARSPRHPELRHLRVRGRRPLQNRLLQRVALVVLDVLEMLVRITKDNNVM